MLAYLVELAPKSFEDPLARALALRVARSFGPRPSRRLESPPTLRSLSRRRLGLIRFREDSAG